MGDAGNHRLWVDEGLLVWDGRALELFKSDGRHDGWRVDARTIERAVIDERPDGSAVLKLYTLSGHFASASVPATGIDDLRRVLDATEQRRSG